MLTLYARLMPDRRAQALRAEGLPVQSRETRQGCEILHEVAPAGYSDWRAALPKFWGVGCVQTKRFGARS